MASPQTERHRRLQARLRDATASSVRALWLALGSWDEQDVAEFALAAEAVAAQARERSRSLVDAYVAMVLGRDPLGFVLDGQRVDPRVLWRRPFVTTWMALGRGELFQSALHLGAVRARELAGTEVTVAQRSSFQAAQDADSQIRGWRRSAAGGSCDYCRLLDGAFVKSADASPIHHNCGCTLEPETQDAEEHLPDGVAVHEHGELGAVLAAPEHEFKQVVS